MNQAMLAKAGWRIAQKDEGLWSSIYQAKYLHSCKLTDVHYKHPPDCSSTWRSISHGASLLRHGLTWRIGNGKTIKFWYDHWVSSKSIIEFALPTAMINPNATVCEFWNANGWNVDLLSISVPLDIL